MNLTLLIGIGGMCCILLGFLLLQRHRITADSLLYDVLNALGSALLVISAIASAAWAFVVLNTIFGLYSLHDIFWSDLRRRARTRN